MPKSPSDRTVYTPKIDSPGKPGNKPLVYWKQILPEDKVQYKDSSGEVRVINFDKDYHEDLIQSFQERAVDQTCFQLATPVNGHGHDFDPERQRAEVLDMRRYDDLPSSVQSEIGQKPGLYAKMRFFDENAAQAVQKNPNLGVSARVRENFTRADGKFVKRAVIHVLGTIDPRVTGMSAWQAADLSYDPDNGDVLDLSEAHYEGNDMGAKNGSVPTDDEIEQMSDEELDQFLVNVATELGYVDSNDDDADEDDELDDEDYDDGGPPTQEMEPVVASAVSLANAQAREANMRALSALKRQAKAEFREFRTEQLAAGVPADILDLAEPILARADDMVVDLSNTNDADVNVSDIVRNLVERFQGTVDLSEESGHSGSVDLGNENDPDQAYLDAWDDQFPSV